MIEPQIYLLSWQDTKAERQPTPQEVYQWLADQGYVIEGPPKVYANGTVQLNCYPDPRERWAQFEPYVVSADTALAIAVQNVVKAKLALEAKPRPSQTDEALLAIIALLLHGYGVSDAG